VLPRLNRSCRGRSPRERGWPSTKVRRLEWLAVSPIDLTFYRKIQLIHCVQIRDNQMQIVDLYTPVAGNSNIFLCRGGTSWGVNMSPRSAHEAREYGERRAIIRWGDYREVTTLPTLELNAHLRIFRLQFGARLFGAAYVAVRSARANASATAGSLTMLRGSSERTARSSSWAVSTCSG
jgi:hypothetical protein